MKSGTKYRKLYNQMEPPTMSNGTTAIPVSPINDMIRALNEGEAAKARVPELEAANHDLSTKLDAAQYHNQRLEENILGYKNHIADLISKVRSLEGERDDASFRVLETEDKLDKLKSAIRHSTRDLDATLMQVDPPKPEPKPEAMAEVKAPMPEITQSHDNTAQEVPKQHDNPSEGSTTGRMTSGGEHISEGSQSKPDPIAASGSGETTQSQNAPISPVVTEGNVSNLPKTEPGPDTFHPAEPDAYWNRNR